MKKGPKVLFMQINKGISKFNTILSHSTNKQKKNLKKMRGFPQF